MTALVDEKHKRRLGLTEGILSSVANIVLFAVKIWVGMLTGSIAMVADAWHTLSDTVTSVVVIFGFLVSAKPGDQEHPFGHGRAELIGSIVIGTLLGVVGLNFLRESYLQLSGGTTIRFRPISIVVFAFSALAKEALAEFSFWAARKTESKSLKADAWHHRSDAIAAALIVIGSLLGARLWWIDGALGIAVATLIVYAAVEIVRDSARVSLGEAASAKLTKNILDLIQREAPQASVVHHIHVHRYGDHIEVTLHLHLPDSIPLKAAHNIATSLEGLLRTKLGIEPTIHVEPASESPLVQQ